MSRLPVLEDLGDVAGKRVLVRTDFNVPMEGPDDARTITDDFRIRAALPTIEWLTSRGATVVCASHLGRPKGKPTPKYSMEPVRRRLAELAPGVELLENLRFNPGEESNNDDFVGQLVAGFDAYVDDAFGAAHRAHASVVGPPKTLPSAAGRLLQKEAEILGGLRDHPKRPFVAVLGGAKVSDKLGVIEALLQTVDALVIGGGMCFTFLAAKGMPVATRFANWIRWLFVVVCSMGRSRFIFLRTSWVSTRTATTRHSAFAFPTAQRVSTSDPALRRPSATSSWMRERCSGTDQWGCSKIRVSQTVRKHSHRQLPTRRRSRSWVVATAPPLSRSSVSTTRWTMCRRVVERRSSFSSSGIFPDSRH